jgi:hypothetical protein
MKSGRLRCDLSLATRSSVSVNAVIVDLSAPSPEAPPPCLQPSSPSSKERFPRPPHAPRDLLAEIAALRQQLAIYKRTVPRPKIRAADRMLWVTLLRLWSGWRDALVIVKPETVIAWQRSAFRR